MLDKKAVDNLAALIKLELSEEEKALYAEQLESVLKYVAELQNAPDFERDYSKLEKTLGQDDIIEELSQEDQSLLVDQFPQKEHSYLQVPAILQENKKFK